MSLFTGLKKIGNRITAVFSDGSSASILSSNSSDLLNVGPRDTGLTQVSASKRPTHTLHGDLVMIEYSNDGLTNPAQANQAGAFRNYRSAYQVPTSGTFTIAMGRCSCLVSVFAENTTNSGAINRRALYQVSSRGNDITITQLGANHTGTGGDHPFTITASSGNLVLTNTMGGNSCQFFVQIMGYLS